MSNSKILTSEEVMEIEARANNSPKFNAETYAFDILRLCATVRHLLEENESLRNQQWTAERVIQWMDDSERKPAIHAFTAGNERQIAYRYERLLEQLK